MKRVIKRITRRANESAIRRYPRRFRSLREAKADDIYEHRFICKMEIVIDYEDEASVFEHKVRNYLSSLGCRLDNHLRKCIRDDIGIGCVITTYSLSKHEYEYSISADITDDEVPDFLNALDYAVSHSEDVMQIPINRCTSTLCSADYYESTNLTKW